MSKYNNPLFDLHTHTIMSGHAYSTLKENVESAKVNGLLAYGFSEHGPKMHGSVSEIYFMNFKVIPDFIDGIRVLCGVEANIIDYDGNIDISNYTTSKIDYIIASLHVNCIESSTIENNTKAIVNAMKNPKIGIIGHPDDSRFPFDVDVVVKASIETNTLLEINNSSLNPKAARINGKENITKLLETCKKYGAKVILGSDAHYCTQVGIFSDVFEILEKVDFPKELIVNYDINNLNEILINKNL